MNLWRMCEKRGRKAIRANRTPFWPKEKSAIMPLVYADSSVLFAWFHPHDEFSAVVDAAVRKQSPDFVYWSFLRFEVRHNLRLARVDSHGEVAWRALRAAEKTASRLRWQTESTADKMLDAAEELSAENSNNFDCGSADYLHVAAARRLHLLNEIDGFWTCDTAQAALAKAAGLKTRLFGRKHPAKENS
jgi:predicted nucleic acid-binding protein